MSQSCTAEAESYYELAPVIGRPIVVACYSLHAVVATGLGTRAYCSVRSTYPRVFRRGRLLKTPSHLKCVATLPCELLMSEIERSLSWKWQLATVLTYGRQQLAVIWQNLAATAQRFRKWGSTLTHLWSVAILPSFAIPVAYQKFVLGYRYGTPKKKKLLGSPYSLSSNQRMT